MNDERRRTTLDDLKRMKSTTISNTLAAEVLGMDPGRLADYARNGVLKWSVTCDPEGGRVYHSRQGFISYWTGEPVTPKKTTEQLLQEIKDLLDIMVKALISIQDVHQREVFLRLIEEAEKKTASVAAPAD